MGWTPFSEYRRVRNWGLLWERARLGRTQPAPSPVGWAHPAPSRQRPFRVYLAGRGDAGIWALQAAPAVDGVFADCAQVGVRTNYL